MNINGFQHAIRVLDIADAGIDYAFVFRLAGGHEVTGYCDPNNVGADLGVALIMNDGDPTQPVNVMVDIESVVAIHLKTFE
jgi:hypothetical protein